MPIHSQLNNYENNIITIECINVINEITQTHNNLKREIDIINMRIELINQKGESMNKIDENLETTLLLCKESIMNQIHNLGSLLNNPCTNFYNISIFSTINNKKIVSNIRTCLNKKNVSKIALKQTNDLKIVNFINYDYSKKSVFQSVIPLNSFPICYGVINMFEKSYDNIISLPIECILKNYNTASELNAILIENSTLEHNACSGIVVLPVNNIDSSIIAKKYNELHFYCNNSKNTCINNIILQLKSNMKFNVIQDFLSCFTPSDNFIYNLEIIFTKKIPHSKNEPMSLFNCVAEYLNKQIDNGINYNLNVLGEKLFMYNKVLYDYEIKHLDKINNHYNVFQREIINLKDKIKTYRVKKHAFQTKKLYFKFDDSVFLKIREIISKVIKLNYGICMLSISMTVEKIIS